MSASVIIIGSGAGGAAAAWSLARRQVHCTVLEAGPHYDYLTDYRLLRPDWEKTGFPAKVPTEGRQTFDTLQALEDKWSDLRSWNKLRGLKVRGDRRSSSGGYKHVVGVGGTTLYFTGEYHRMNRRAMALETDYGVGADWPLDYDTLEPYYLEAERLVGTSGPGGDARRPRSADYPLPPLPSALASLTLRAGHERLGLSFPPNSLAVLSEPYDDRPNCNFCGNCNRGCPRGDKGTADVTYLRHAVQSGYCTILTGQEVKRLEHGPDGRVQRAIVAGPDGSLAAVVGDVFVLAAGAIESPRLLLNSEMATATGNVGRNLMETLAWTSIGLHPDPIGSHRGHPSDSICWDFNDPDAIDGIPGGFRMSPGTAEANLVGPINYAARVVGGWGEDHRQRMKELFGRALALSAFGENLPNPGSFVDLDPEARDAHGFPKARINSFLPDMELQRLRQMRNVVRQVLAASGVAEIIEESGTYDEFGSSHVFGTCRMGREEEGALVGDTCQSFEHSNLVIADASVFPSTGGGESPSLTISALAIRAMEALISRN